MDTGKIGFRGGLILLGACLFNTYAQAQQASNWWYAELGVSRSVVDIAGTEFNPILPKAKLGIFVTQKILLEVQYSGSGDDQAANTDLEIDNIKAAYLRLDSGIRSNMRMYVLLGNAETTLTVKRPGETVGVSDTYSDVSYAIGIEDRTFSKSTLLTLEYTRYYNNDDVTISALSLGFKYEY